MSIPIKVSSSHVRSRSGQATSDQVHVRLVQVKSKVGSCQDWVKVMSAQVRFGQFKVRSRSGRGQDRLGRSVQGRVMSGLDQVKVMSKSSLVKVRSSQISLSTVRTKSS